MSDKQGEESKLITLPQALQLAEHDPAFRLAQTGEAFHAGMLLMGWQEYANELPKLKDKVPITKQVERLRSEARSKVRLAGLGFAATGAKGSALAAQRLLWELLASGDWAEERVIKATGVTARGPREFVRGVVKDTLGMDDTTATMWADTFIFMHDYLYNPIYSSAIGIEEGTLVDDPLLGFLQDLWLGKTCLRRNNSNPGVVIDIHVTQSAKAIEPNIGYLVNDCFF